MTCCYSDAIQECQWLRPGCDVTIAICWHREARKQARLGAWATEQRNVARRAAPSAVIISRSRILVSLPPIFHSTFAHHGLHSVPQRLHGLGGAEQLSPAFGPACARLHGMERRIPRPFPPPAAAREQAIMGKTAGRSSSRAFCQAPVHSRLMMNQKV